VGSARKSDCTNAFFHSFGSGADCTGNEDGETERFDPAFGPYFLELNVVANGRRQNEWEIETRNSEAGYPLYQEVISSSS